MPLKGNDFFQLSLVVCECVGCRLTCQDGVADGVALIQPQHRQHTDLVRGAWSQTGQSHRGVPRVQGHGHRLSWKRDKGVEARSSNQNPLFFYLLQCLFLTVLGVSICQFKSRNTALGLGPRHGHRVLGHMTKNQVWGRLWTWCSTFTGYIWTSRLHNKSDVQQDVLMRLNIIRWEDILDHHIRSMSVCIYVQTHIYTVYTPYTT